MQLVNPLAADDEWRQIRLWEVAVVVCLLFATLRHRNTFRLNPAACLLMNGVTGTQHGDLALGLVFQCMLNRTEAVHVFDLRLDAQLLLTTETHRNVSITTEAALLHTPRGNAQVDQNLTQLLHIEPRLFRATHVRLTDNLHQWRTRAIDIYKTIAPMVQEASCILFQMHAIDTDFTGLSIVLNRQIAIPTERNIILRNLIARHQI